MNVIRKILVATGYSAVEEKSAGADFNLDHCWRTIGEDLEPARRTWLTGRLGDCVERWIDAYNVGLYVIYWVAYAISLTLILIMLKQLERPLAGWAKLPCDPAITWPHIVTGICALGVITAVYVKKSSDIYPFGLPRDLTWSSLIAISMIAVAAMARAVAPASTWVQWVSVTGFVGCIWFPFLMLDSIVLAVVTKAWVERLIDSYPVEVIAYGLKEFIRIAIEPQDGDAGTTLWLRTATALDLEYAAVAAQRGLCRAFIQENVALNTWLKDQCCEIAGALREFEHAVVLPNRSSRENLEKDAAVALRAVMEEDWESFPRVLINAADPDQADRSWADNIRLVLVAALPGLGVLGAYWLNQHNSSHPLVPEPLLFWAALISLAWLVVNLLRALAPDLDSRISSFTAVVGALSGLSLDDKKGKK